MSLRNQEAEPCPHCRAPMQALELPGHYGRKIEINSCRACALFWFDTLESTRLAAPAAVDLIRLIHATQFDSGTARQIRHARLDDSLSCPRCDAPLKKIHNRGRFGRFIAYECPAQHGCCQSQMHYLAEKGFFRPYTTEDIRRLRAAGTPAECSQCGFVLDERPVTECPACDAPVGLTDAAALAAAVDRERTANPLEKTPLRHIPVCPHCGAPLDLGQEAACSRCGTLAPPELGEARRALAASEAVAAQVMANHAQRSGKVIRQSLDNMDAATFSLPAFRDPHRLLTLPNLLRFCLVVATLIATAYMISAA